MEHEVRYRGKTYTLQEISEIRELIQQQQDKSRFFISKELCKKWNWRQPNGVLKDMVCRGLMLFLHREGLIELPPRKHAPYFLLSRKAKPAYVEVDRSPIVCTLSELKPIELTQVRRTPLEKLYKGLINTYHYLGYTRPVGEHLEYMAFSQNRPIACIGWCSAPRHIGCRDRYLGWNKEERIANLHKIAINTRFLILPWVRIPHLASYLLGLMARMISHDWKSVYNHEILWLETFVDPERGFKGTCYRAANWRYLGLTTGRGKNDHTNKPNRSLKYVLGYPLRKDFKEALIWHTVKSV